MEDVIKGITSPIHAIEFESAFVTFSTVRKMVTICLITTWSSAERWNDEGKIEGQRSPRSCYFCNTDWLSSMKAYIASVESYLVRTTPLIVQWLLNSRRHLWNNDEYAYDLRIAAQTARQLMLILKNPVDKSAMWTFWNFLARYILPIFVAFFYIEKFCFIEKYYHWFFHSELEKVHAAWKPMIIAIPIHEFSQRRLVYRCRIVYKIDLHTSTKSLIYNCPNCVQNIFSVMTITQC